MLSPEAKSLRSDTTITNCSTRKSPVDANTDFSNKSKSAPEIISLLERSRYGDNAAVLNSPEGSLSAGVIHVLAKIQFSGTD